MGIDKLNGANGVSKASQTSNSQKLEELAKLQIQQIQMPSTKALKKVTNQDVEQVLNEPSPIKAFKNLMDKSPVGLGQEPTKEDLEKLGYTFAQTAYHIGAPVVYKSGDGGSITVYNGKGSAEMGENIRKTVYENGRYKQEMFYDESGNLAKCEIRIKDELGLTEPNGRITMFYNNDGKPCFIR